MTIFFQQMHPNSCFIILKIIQIFIIFITVFVFQEKVLPKADEKEPTTDTTHHIIPRQQINQTVLNDIEKDKNNVKEVTQEYINNNPAVKEVIVDQLLNKNLPPEKHGKLLHAAYTHNPNNLVRGPSPSDRARDPNRKSAKPKIDQEILNAQPKEYQDAIARADKDRTTKSFTKIPPPTQIQTDESKYHWEKNNKYIVVPPKQVILI